jgi:hypothetical protein
VLAGAALLLPLASPALADPSDDGAVVPRLQSTSPSSVSTVPPDGDVNPYGVAFVPAGFPRGGALDEGDILVSNFNDADNLQGTGTTIVRVDRHGRQSLFFAEQDATAPGLSTALAVLRRGFVLVGNVPSVNGSESGPGVCSDLQLDVGPGSLLVLDRNANVVQVLTSQTFLDGPWDLTVEDEGSRAQLFVSNVLSGTVSRLDLQIRGDDDGDPSGDPIFVEAATRIASGYTTRCDPAAFVVGPTGLALDAARDVLYVASTADNTIFAVPGAGSRQTDGGQGTNVVPDRIASRRLHGPLGLLLAPNGDLVSAQGDAVNADPNQPSEIVELTPQGRFVAQISIDPSPGGAFGLALSPRGQGFRFAAVDDNQSSLLIWNVE